MTFRQLYDQTSGTYSYLLASRPGGDLHLVKELDLKLVKAMDTHLHADHITGLGALRDLTRCVTVMGEQTKADVVSMRLGTATIYNRRACARCHLYPWPHRRFLQFRHAVRP
jgi:glyoxylase-like metal-dependent hydrolase (beta-lactamase superfamily II)